MRSIASFCSFTLPRYNPSHGMASDDKVSSIKSANFAQIPSWVSLKSSPPSFKTPTHQQGQVENVHLISLSKQGKLKEAHEFLEQMDETGVSVSPQAYQYLFETCSKSKSLSYGTLIHDRLRRTVKNPSGYLENCVLQMYCDCGSFVDARRLFDEMLERNLISWVIIISAHANGGFLDEAFGLFCRMIELRIKPNASIYASLLKSLINPSLLDIGKQMHSHVIKSRLAGNASIATSISNMYVKCGWLEGAKLAFERVVEKKAAGWTGLMVGYTQADKEAEALKVFATMVQEGVELDEFVFSIILKACARLEDFNLGRKIHCQIIKLGLESEVSVGTPLVDFYVKCASFDHARRAFDRIREPNDVSWSALICGYCQIGGFEEAFEIFKSLRGSSFLLNSFIYTNIFQACSVLADFNTGAQVHADAIKRGLIAYLHGESAMITMYSKCGRVDHANRAFESIAEPDAVAWTAIISGHAYHGNAFEALRLFRMMLESGRPNAVTFVAVLTACSHSGLVAEAKQYLESMGGEYGVNPTIDHYDCMIDVYSRAGLLKEAHNLICSMPFEPDAMSWKCLLSGCWTYRNLELGKVAAEKVRQLDPDDTAGYVLMFNLCASAGKWEEAAQFRRMMAERNLRKELGCSWITVRDKVNRFIVGDKHHPQTKLIYSKLEEFNEADESGLLAEEDISRRFPAREEQLLVHSEKLAIAFGLISTPSNAPIVVFKNLRSCKDCHDFAKQVSSATGREIVVRDSCRFHHFQSGHCSCDDYW